MNNILNPDRVCLLNGDDRGRVINRSVARLNKVFNKELQAIDDENDLTYEEINQIFKRFELWSSPVQYTAR